MTPRCQSCGMPMDRDPQGGGTNADGSKSAEYCSYCYRSGAFVDGFTTAKQMQELVKGKLREMGYGRFMAWLMTLDTPRLRRWRK